MLAPLLALALCILASLSGAVLAQPVLTACGVPPGVLRLVPTLLFACLLVPPVLLSGDWLWMNGKRRSGPPRGQILARLAIMTALLALVGPLTLTERPMSEIASSARALAGTWTNDGPVELEKSARTVVTPAPDPTILPTPADAQFPTAPVVL